MAAEGALLLQAVATGEPATAMPVFLPEAAYAQIKSLWDDATDWQDRLVGHLDLDVGAAHRVVGASATFVALDLAAGHVRWIPPGACTNRLGYWYAPGGRLVYEEGGTERSIGVAAMISWRGWWYLVHLGTELPPPGRGVVDAPAAGVGSYGPAGGC